MADPSRDVILEAVHFLVEIGNPRHIRLSGMHSIRSYDFHAAKGARWIESDGGCNGNSSWNLGLIRPVFFQS